MKSLMVGGVLVQILSLHMSVYHCKLHLENCTCPESYGRVSGSYLTASKNAILTSQTKLLRAWVNCASQDDVRNCLNLIAWQAN